MGAKFTLVIGFLEACMCFWTTPFSFFKERNIPTSHGCKMWVTLGNKQNNKIFILLQNSCNFKFMWDLWPSNSTSTGKLIFFFLQVLDKIHLKYIQRKLD